MSDTEEARGVPFVSFVALAQARRRNRQWMVLLLVVPLVVGGITLAAWEGSGTTGPALQPSRVPAGYRPVTAAPLVYPIPRAWTQSAAYSSDNGDFYFAGPGGWVGEAVGIQSTLPTAGRDRPPQLGLFGAPTSRRYTLGPPHPLRISGMDRAWSFPLTRPHGFTALAIEAWQRSSHTVAWIVIRANRATTHDVVTSMRA